MYLILHPLLHNFIQLPLITKYKANPDLYYNNLLNLSFKLSHYTTGQLASCERETWQELARQYLELDNYQSNIYYDTWSTIAKLVILNKSEEETSSSNKKLNKVGKSSNSSLNTVGSNDKSKLKSSKKLSQSSFDSLTIMNENTIEFDRNNYIWGWPFFMTFLFYQLIEVKEENSDEIEDLYLEINDNLENPHFDYNDNLFFWVRNLTKYLFLMNNLLDKSCSGEFKEATSGKDEHWFNKLLQDRIPDIAVSSINCKVVDLIFCRVKECKNSIVYNGNESLKNQNNDNDPIDYSKYGKYEQFMPYYNSTLASLSMIQNITKIKGKSFEYLKLKDIQQWIMDKLVNTTQVFNNQYNKLDPFKPTPLISVKLLPIVELVCSEGGVIRGTFPSSFYMKESVKHNVNRHVILRNQSKKFIYIPCEFVENTHLHLQNLSYCEIYILSTVKSITITNSHHCKCIFGCIASRLTLNTVQDIKFSACTEQATYEKCQQITGYLYIKKPSLVIGKCIRSLFVAPINTWYKDINKHIKQARIQLSNGQKNNWNNLQLVWFDKNNFKQAVNDERENLQLNANSKNSSQNSEINIYHKLNKVLNLKKSDAQLQEKIHKIFLLPSECYELFVIPIFSKKKSYQPKLNLKTYSIDNLDNLEYDENYQHSIILDQDKPNNKKGSTIKNIYSNNKTTVKSKSTKGSTSNLSKSKGKGMNEKEISKNADYSNNVLNKLPSDYYKSVMQKHEGHCLIHHILSDKKADSRSEIISSFDDYEDTTEDNGKCSNTEDDINALVRNDFYKWLKETNNIEQVQRLLNYKKENE